MYLRDLIFSKFFFQALQVNEADLKFKNSLCFGVFQIWISLGPVRENLTKLMI